MGRDFSALDRFGHREYLFAQADSYDLVRHHYPRLSGGACIGVALNWIKEKLTTSHGLFRENGLLSRSLPGSQRNSFSHSMNPLRRMTGKSATHNQAAMLSGAMVQTAYYTLNNDASAVASELGLIKGEYSPQAKIVKGEAPSHLPERLHAESVAEAAAHLPRGVAILVDLKPTQGNGGGHSIAFYRSRGDTLYFFDPNAGVYTIPNARNILPFIEAWLNVYLKIDGITWITQPDDWCLSFLHTRR